MKLRKIELLLLTFMVPLCGFQGNRSVYKPMPEIRDLLRPDDRGEYYSLYQACKVIRDMQVTIHDSRMTLLDAITTSVTLYLQRVNTLAAQVLLRDLQNKEFRMD